MALWLSVAALGLVACTSAASRGDCGSRTKCPPAQPAYHALHLLVDGRQVTARTGLPTVRVKSGQPTTLSLSIDRQNGTVVSNVYLFISGKSWGLGGDGPSGQVEVLTRHAAELPAGGDVVATWTPSGQSSADKLAISTEFDIAGSQVGETIANLLLVP
jgi:hypothetical protein